MTEDLTQSALTFEKKYYLSICFFTKKKFRVGARGSVKTHSSSEEDKLVTISCFHCELPWNTGLIEEKYPKDICPSHRVQRRHRGHGWTESLCLERSFHTFILSSRSSQGPTHTQSGTITWPTSHTASTSVQDMGHISDERWTTYSKNTKTQLQTKWLKVSC